MSGWSFSSSRVKWGTRAPRSRRSASRRTLGVEDVRNGTVQTATETVALTSTMLSTSSVQHGGAELPLCPKIGAAQQRRPAVISPNGLTRRNCARTSLSGNARLSVTTAMRASAGTRFNAMLQPIQPARVPWARAASAYAAGFGASGSRLMMADSVKANCLLSSLDSMPAFTLRLRYASADCFP